ncbi:MAG TPA: general stress protein [Herpetosiphonaceae bacterium]
MMTDMQPPSPHQTQLIVAIFDDQARAEAAVRDLQQQGFAEEQLSVVLHRDATQASPEEVVELDREAEETGEDVAIGGTLGGLAGLLGGLALFSIPALGPFLGVGVLATTIGGAALGSALGERVAHLVALGVPQERTRRYGQALEAGQIVLGVTARSSAEVHRAREVLALHEADEIDVHPQPRPM